MEQRSFAWIKGLNIMDNILYIDTNDFVTIKVHMICFPSRTLHITYAIRQVFLVTSKYSQN